MATEYLGTTQIVTLETEHGRVKARVAVRSEGHVGDAHGLDFDARTITLVRRDVRPRAALSKPTKEVLIHG